jgi:VIT1/CCC1 family predicted Fe2+/Mn2+ transporter
VLSEIAAGEKKHYRFWKEYTGKDVTPNKLRFYFYILIAKLAGLTFALKLMEGVEEVKEEKYENLSIVIPNLVGMVKDERRYELGLLSMVDEKRLRYIGSIVLGINDALVELTGALAGFTLALGQSRVVVATGMITGIAASFSMGISEYLSTQAETTERNALRSGIYTGGMYFLVVVLLVFPFLLPLGVVLSLATTLFMAVVIIYIFSFYISVTQGLNFRKRFLQMATLSLGVASLTFLVGFFVQKFLGVRI